MVMIHHNDDTCGYMHHVCIFIDRQIGIWKNFSLATSPRIEGVKSFDPGDRGCPC